MTVTLDTRGALLREDLAHRTGADVRAAARAGRWNRATHGLARGYLQANLAIVRERYAFDFLRFCQRNPKPCPVIDVTDPGNPEPSHAAPGSDIRTDLPGYCIYRDGKRVAQVADIKEHWHADSVAFLLGCSNSMDEVLLGPASRSGISKARTAASPSTSRISNAVRRAHSTGRSW